MRVRPRLYRLHRAGGLLILGLGTLLAATAQAQTAPSQAAADPLQVLKLDGAVPQALSAADTSCSPLTLKISYNGNLINSINATVAAVNAQMQQRDFIDAEAKSRLAAEGYSYCYSHYGSDTNAGIYAAAVGHFLTAEAVAAHNFGVVSPDVTAAMGRARTLLTYAKGAGQDTSSDLAALDTLNPPKRAPVGPTISKTAKAVVAAFQGNQLGFDSRYDNHVLQVSGPARKVLEAFDGSVWIMVVGHTPEDLPSDDVVCDITAAAQKQKAAQLSIPGPVTVVGTYHSAHGALGRVQQVTLSDCNVVDAPSDQGK